jgi:hypothetical protein
MNGWRVAGTLALSAVASVLGAQGCSSGGQECFRAVTCVKQCGGPVVQSGCAACPSGTFDSLQCDAAVECFRAVDCVQQCGGPVVASGCSCPAGTFDRLTCTSDASADGPTDAGSDAPRDASDGG